MIEPHMVHLMTVGSSFHGKVLVARLGAAGVLTQLRGAVDGPYPIGDVLVDVDADDLEVARQLLLADQVEAAFEEAMANDILPVTRRRPQLVAALALAFVLVVLLLGCASVLA